MPTESGIVGPEDVKSTSEDKMAVEDAIRVLTGQQSYAETLQTILNFLYRIVEYEQRTQHELKLLKDMIHYPQKLGSPMAEPDFERLYRDYWGTMTKVDPNAGTATLTYNDLLNAIKALEQRDQVVYPIIWNTEQMVPDKGEV